MISFHATQIICVLIILLRFLFFLCLEFLFLFFCFSWGFDVKQNIYLRETGSTTSTSRTAPCPGTRSFVRSPRWPRFETPFCMHPPPPPRTAEATGESKYSPLACGVRIRSFSKFFLGGFLLFEEIFREVLLLITAGCSLGL